MIFFEKRYAVYSKAMIPKKGKISCQLFLISQRSLNAFMCTILRCKDTQLYIISELEKLLVVVCISVEKIQNNSIADNSPHIRNLHLDDS